MPDDPVPSSGVRMSICPWCSASYAGEPDVCPSCGAALAVDPTTDPSLPGLTAIDPEAVLRAKAPVARPRNRLLSWISGDYTDEVGTAAEEGALAPPPVEVRREMLRLELAAEVANLQAEADSYMADVAAAGSPGAVAEAVPSPVAADVPPDAAPPVDAGPPVTPAPAIDAASSVDARAPVGDASDAASSADVADAADPAPPIDPADDRGATPA